MKRWRRLIFAVLIFLLALIGTAYWAATTSQGLHFLLKAVSVISPVHLQAREIKGSLTDSNLRVTGLTIRWDEVEIACAALDLDWQPGELRRRNLFVKRVHAQGISIRDRRPALKTSPKFIWPVIAWAAWINGRADDIQAEDLNYRRLDDPPIAVTRISSSLALEKGVLQVKDLRIFSPEGHGEGTASVSFARPELHLRIKAFPAEKYARCDSFSASLDLSAGKRGEQGAGPVLISGSRGDAEILRLEGRVGVTSTALTFQDFQLIQPGRQGTVKGKGEWIFANKAGLALQVLFSQFDLEREIGRKTMLSGAVDFKGAPNAFEGSFRIANQGDGWQAASVEGSFRGAGKKVTIQDLKGEWLKGRISGTASIDWQDRVTAETSLRGRNLNPGAFGKSGPLNLDLEGKLHFPKGESPVGDFQVRLAEKEGDRGARAVLKVRLKEKATHTASFSLTLPRGEVRASLSGAYRDGTLREVIESLEGKDPSGNWVMQGPTQVQVSSRELRVMPMRLSSPRGEKVKLAAQLQFDPFRGAVEASWQQIDLARANQFFEKDHIAGRTQGEVAARWEKDQGWQIAGTVNLEGRFTQDSMVVRVPSGRGKITWGEKGLQANLDLKIGGGGRIQGKVASPEPVGLGLPARGKTESGLAGHRPGNSPGSSSLLPSLAGSSLGASSRRMAARISTPGERRGDRFQGKGDFSAQGETGSGGP